MAGTQFYGFLFAGLGAVMALLFWLLGSEHTMNFWAVVIASGMIAEAGYFVSASKAFDRLAAIQKAGTVLHIAGLATTAVAFFAVIFFVSGPLTV